MVEASVRHPDLCPTHPGETLREDVFPSLGLTTATAAARIGVSRGQLGRVVSGRAAMTPAMALRIGRLTGTAPRLWMNMQTAHDLWRVGQNLDIGGISQAKVA